MALKSYRKHKNLSQECYNTQLQLPPPAIKKHNTLIEEKGDYFRWKNSKFNLWKLIWHNAAKFITLLLAVQVGSVQASGGNVTKQKEVSANERIELHTTGMVRGFIPTMNRSSLFISQYEHEDFRNENNINKRQANASTDTRISQQLKQKVFHRFDKINDDLQVIIKIFIANKPAGSTEPPAALVLLPISFQPGQSQECIVSKDALGELKNVINDALLGITTTQTEFNCEPNAINTNSCDDILKLIQCGVNHLKIGFIDATQNINSLEQYIKLNYELYQKFQKIRDQINQQTSEKYKQQLDDCNMNMQELHKYLNTTTLQLKEQIKGLCISAIGNGHIETAVKRFKDLNAFDDDHLVRDIIEKAYTDFGQLNNFDNIINFIAGLLPWFSQIVVSYEALFDNMEKNTPKILIFVMKVQKAKELPPIANENSLITRLDNLKSKSLTYVDNFSNAWIHKIRNNDYEEVLKFSQTYTDAINFNLDRLIERTYANELKNAEKIIEFIRNLPNIHSSIISLHSLFNQMKNHGKDFDSYELLMLAYHCKELIVMKSYQSLTRYYKDQLKIIKDNLPDSVRRLIWDGSDCTLRNRVFNEYLYAANAGYAHDQERRKVYTLRSKNVNNECHWKIKPHEYGKFFSIQNTYYNDEYLYAAAEDLAHDDERRNVFTWRYRSAPEPWTYWRLVPINNGEYFVLHYKDYHYEYLYPGFDKLVRDAEARYVFTWRHIAEAPTNEGHWDIYC